MLDWRKEPCLREFPGPVIFDFKSNEWSGDLVGSSDMRRSQLPDTCPAFALFRPC